MKEGKNAIIRLHDNPIQSVRINPQRAQALKKLCRRISDETGVAIREAEIVNYLIDKGLPRLVVNTKGLAMK